MKAYDAWLTHDPAMDHDGECGAWNENGTMQCGELCEHEGPHGFTYLISDYPSIQHKTYLWDQRPDDFDEDGMPTVRP